MTEIYWITRLNALNGLFTAVTVVSTIAWIACLIGWIINMFQAEEYSKSEYREREAETCRGFAQIFKRLFVCIFPVAIFAYAGLLFTPTTKEAMAIYGIGGTIDYIKSNDKAKELPDKCVEALTRYVDSIKKEDKKNN